jgi:UDP-GlcNAc:undecaprenyl-phosphate/decaprenyl-phosphate GlcNAc-1-phosphate transferase
VIYGFLFFSFLLSFFLLHQYYKSHWSVMDVPNHRSMHEYPVKKSAGLIFMSIFVISVSIFSYIKSSMTDHIFYVLSGVSLFVILGLLDDIYDLRSIHKLVVQFIIVYLLLYFFISTEYHVLRISSFSYPVVARFFTTLLIVFVMNLCNFMDGLDLYLSLNSIFAIGILFVCFSAFLLETSWILFIFLSVIFSFLFFNYPPARLFMGDSGSLSIGFLLASLPLFIQSQNQDFSMIFFFIPFYWTDGLVTIFKRLLQKENILQAHRQHLYQKISLKCWSKKQTSITLSLLNLLSLPTLLTLNYYTDNLFIFHLVFAFVYLCLYALFYRMIRLDN